MACCLLYPADICLVNGCTGEIDIKMIAPAPGTYKLFLSFLGVALVIEETFGLDDPMIFTSNNLNENFEYIGHIIDPAGQKFVITIDDVNFDSIKFKTTTIVSI